MFVKNGMTGAATVHHMDTCREKAKHVKAPPLRDLSYGPIAKVGLLGALFVAAVAVGQKDAKDQEAKEAAYDKCMEEDGYFEASVPTGVYNTVTGSGDVSVRASAVDEFVQTDRFKVIEEWGRARSQDTIEAYEAYRTNFPDAPETDLASKRIDELVLARNVMEASRDASFWIGYQEKLPGLGIGGWQDDTEPGSEGCPRHSEAVTRGNLKFLVDDGLAYGFLDINFRDERASIVGAYEQDGSVRLYSNWPEGNPVKFVGRFDPAGEIRLRYASDGGNGCERTVTFTRVPDTSVSAGDAEAIEKWLDAPVPAREELVELYERLADRPLLLSTNSPN